MASEELYRHPTTPTDNRLVAVYSLSTTSSFSSGSSCSNYATARSTVSYDPCTKIPPQDIINTLNLLEEAEQEISYEVARIRDEIKETRAMVEKYRRERRARVKENATLVAEEALQTKRTGEELWFAV